MAFLTNLNEVQNFHMKNYKRHDKYEFFLYLSLISHRFYKYQILK